MELGIAVAVIKDINRDDFTDAEKIEAIARVLDMETDNSIFKRDYKAATKWLIEYMKR